MDKLILCKIIVGVAVLLPLVMMRTDGARISASVVIYILMSECEEAINRHFGFGYTYMRHVSFVVVIAGALLIGLGVFYLTGFDLSTVA